jgi:hypothetical protein
MTSTYVDQTFVRLQGIAFREQIVKMVVAHMEHSESHFQGVRAKWPRLYDLWRGNWSGRFHPHKNNVHIPLIFSSIWADAARKVATSLNDYPVVSFLGYGPDDMPIARKREALISAQMKDDNCFLKQVDTVVSADLYGVAVMQIGWKKFAPMRVVEYVDRAPLSGKIVRHIKKQNVVMFDGPESLNIDLLDFFPQPTVPRLQDMKWVVRRYFLDLDDCRYLASIGAFDKAELNRLEREGSVGMGNTFVSTSIRRFQVRTGMDDETARFMDKYSRPIEILEMWGTVPSEFAPDGCLQRVCTVANRRYLLRNKPNPYNHGMLPFVCFTPTPDMHYFYAPGKAEVTEKIQIVANRYLNQSLDAADLQIDPIWFYNRAAGLVTKNLYARPGKFIPINGNPADMIQPMRQDLNGLTIADQKVAQMRGLADMATGVNDAVSGLTSADSRQTAREFVGKREAAGTRLLLESRIYEEMLLEPMANMFVALDKQFLELPVEVLILGDGALLDPITQTPIPRSRERLSGYDLTPNYAARALGASVGLSKGMQQQALGQLLQSMNGPMGQAVMGQINVVNFWRSIFRAFDVHNINEVFTQDPRLMKILSMNDERLLGPRSSAGGGVPESLMMNVPTSGQIAGPGGMGMAAVPGMGAPPGLQGASPDVLSQLGLQQLPGQPRGSAQGLLAPPNIANNLPAMVA